MTPGQSATLAIGTSLQGQKDYYTVSAPVYLGGHSMLYAAKTSAGAECLVRYYNGESTMQGDVRQAFLKLGRIPGMLIPEDTGTVMGLPFDVYAPFGQDMSKASLSLQDIRERVIPQMFWVLSAMHSRAFLLRDIRPSSFLWDAGSRSLAYYAHDNLAFLTGGSTATRAAAYGLDQRYVSPEAVGGEYSIYSDRYACGVTLFALLKGQAAFGAFGEADFSRWKTTGFLPKTADLQQMDPQFMGDSQSVQYLIQALTQTEPRQRWGYPEVKVWCRGYVIPMHQSGRQRVLYQMDRPVQVQGKDYWDYAPLGLALAEHGDDPTCERVPVTLYQRYPQWPKLRQIMDDNKLSAQARLFQTAVLLCPGLPALYWRGQRYNSSADLAKRAAKNRQDMDALQEMLENRCFTFLMSQRKQQDPRSLRLLEEMEECERQKRGEGAHRFIQVLSGTGQGTALLVLGKAYPTFSSFVSAWAGRPEELRQKAGEILRDQGFQAYVWFKGAGRQLQALQTQAGEDFWRLLVLLELLGNAKEKAEVRRAWMESSAWAPLLFLHSHLGMYTILDENHPQLQSLRHFQYPSGDTLKTLSERLPEAVKLYQNVVSLCENNVLAMELGVPGESGSVIRPKQAEYAFCEYWDGLEVPPAFLQERGLTCSGVGPWLDRAEGDVHRWLDEQGKDLANVQYDPRKDTEFFRKDRNLAAIAAVAEILTAMSMLSSSHVGEAAFLLVAGFCLCQVWLYFHWRYCFNMSSMQKQSYEYALRSSEWINHQRNLLHQERVAMEGAVLSGQMYTLEKRGTERPIGSMASGGENLSRKLPLMKTLFMGYVSALSATLLAAGYHLYLPGQMTGLFLLKILAFTAILFGVFQGILCVIQKEIRTTGLIWSVYLTLFSALLIIGATGVSFLENTVGVVALIVFLAIGVMFFF
ncbi:MAG: hypothetical protein IJ083_05330 [Clostridia bacterium]|nr:hypothetical protein [Clostridia bacterium]